MKIAVINGPNLNMLGKREPGVYGTRTLSDLDQELGRLGEELDVTVSSFQSNIEGEIVSFIQKAADEVNGFVLNAGGYTHTSVAIRDAVASIGKPVVEVHISNPAARESFRQISLLSGVCAGTISGFGFDSYKLAILWLSRFPPLRPEK
jgi:3-dehydroquinate dehydratase II